MDKETTILFWVFLASLPFCYLVYAPSVLLLVAVIAFHINDAMFVPEPPAESEDQAAALKTLAVLFKEQAKQVDDLRTEVNGLQLRAGMGLKK